VIFLQWINKIIHGDALSVLKKSPANFVDMVMTSPPYWGLRNYGASACRIWDGNPECRHEWVESKVYYSKPHHGIGSKTMAIPSVTMDALKSKTPQSMFCRKCGAWYGQLGLEPSPDMYVNHLMQIFREIKRVLKPTGSFYLNMGDTYAGSNCGSHDRTNKSKNFTNRKQYRVKYEKAAPQAHTKIPRKSLSMIPERVALAMIEDGWILRNKIIWHKPNPMPSSVKDRLTNTWEYLFHFVKNQKYYYDLDAIREPHKTASIERTKRKWDGHREPGTSWQGMDISKMCHPKGKNPGDFVKHDIAVGRIGNFSYTDPLHTKAYNPDGKNPGDVFEITTKPFPEAHFAVYPEELCVKPIKSSCPEWVCKKCGKPKRKVVITGGYEDAFNIRVRDAQRGKMKHNDRKASQQEIANYNEREYTSKVKVRVIAEGCNCNAGFEPGIVLDPFCGAGTTCVVAKKLGRRFIGIEINEKYCEMARERLLTT